MLIRVLTADDDLLPFALWVSLAPDTIVDRRQINDPLIQVWIADWGRRPDDLGVGVVVDRQMVAAAWMRRMKKNPMPQLSLAVHPKYRGQRLGRTALEGLLNLASKKGITEVNLTVAEDNSPALCLYQTIGFRQEKKKKGMLIMSLILSERKNTLLI